MFIEGVWKLKEPILCRRSVSGTAFKACVSDVSIDIQFPTYPVVSDYCDPSFDMKLLPPEGLASWEVNWGYITNTALGTFVVDALMVSFTGSGEETQSVYDSFTSWVERVNELLLIRTNAYVFPAQKEFALVRGGGFDNGIELYIHNENRWEYIPNTTQPYLIELQYPPAEQYLGELEVQALFDAASSNSTTSLQYELIANSYRAVIRRDFRSAVILAGSALEKSLVDRIKRFYDSAHLSGFKKERKKHLALGGKFTWIEGLRIPIPYSEYRKDIVSLRNDVVHDGLNPDYEATIKCLKACNIIIRSYTPRKMVLEDKNETACYITGEGNLSSEPPTNW